MASTLSDRQQADLHRSILDYLFSAGFMKSYDQFKDEVPELADFAPDPKAKTSGLLVKKWTSVIRMQRKIMDLEARLAQAVEEISQVAHLTTGGARRSNQDWIPSAPARHTLSGHRAVVNALSFHPTFSSLATASEDATLKIWDWESGELERTLKGHTKSVTDCQYDSKGKNLVSCSYDLFIKVWSVDNDYKNSATLRGHEHSISSVRFMPGDDRVVSASRDQTVRIWELATTHCVKVIRAHTDWIRCATPSLDRRWILTCSNDHTARLVDAETGSVKAELRGHEHVVETAVFVPTASIPAIRELVALPETAPGAKLDSLALTFVATGSRDKTVKIWDALRGQCLWTFVGHDNWIRGLVFHPSGKFLLSAADDYTVRIWDLKTGRCVKRIDAHDQFVSCITWGRQLIGDAGGDGGQTINVIATGSSDKTVKVWLPSGSKAV